MDQDAENENFEEEATIEDISEEQITVAPPLESAFSKYLREYRLLNSLLISLVMIIGVFVAMWNIVVFVAAAGDGDADFSDAGTAPAQQNQEKKKVVKLMQRQKKAKPKAQQTPIITTKRVINVALKDRKKKKKITAVIPSAPTTKSAISS